MLKEELTAIRDKYGDDRVTEIQDVEDEIDIEDLIEEEQCVFTLTQAGYIKRTPVSEYAAQSKGAWARKASLPGRRTTWWTCSPPPPMTIFCSSPTLARCTGRRAIRFPRAARPPRGLTLSTSCRWSRGSGYRPCSTTGRPARRSCTCSWSPARAR